jgi:hypothetical protein
MLQSGIIADMMVRMHSRQMSSIAGAAFFSAARTKAAR